MSQLRTRRELLQGGLTLAGLAMLGLPDWAMPALAQGETLVPFVDFPENFPTVIGADRRIIDVRRIDAWLTPRDQFFTTQHYGHPEMDAATFRLRVTGLVDRPLSLSIADLQAIGSSELVAGFECSGNRRPIMGSCSNGRWTGVPLRTVLTRAGVQEQGQEFIFFGADKGPEELDFRGTKYNVEQQFGRSLTRDKALSPEPMLAWALNAEPLTKHQGAPLRLLVPGWYGVANVKWLTQIHVQRDPYVGKYQVRWYRTLRSETIDGEVKWLEAAVTHMHLKSFIARVTRRSADHQVFGVVLNDGTPIKSVEVKVDDGAWQAATLDRQASQFSWKWFTWTWKGATPGEHTLVSRVIDTTGQVQPTVEEQEIKKTYLEDSAQFPRKVVVTA
jgi:DMSO/TMAO reductase YedYZ molybdopterin-dependent catalytic subunit